MCVALLQLLHSNISQLLGGQQELAAALAAATDQEKTEWAEATAKLGAMAASLDEIRDGVGEVVTRVSFVQETAQRVDSKVSEVAVNVQRVQSTVDGMDRRVVEINRDVQELAAYIRGLRQAGKTAVSGSCSSGKGSDSTQGGMLRSRLVLSSSQVKWEAAGPFLDRGSFANVYPGTYDGAHVAIKQLDMSSFAGKAEEEVGWRLAGVCMVCIWQCGCKCCCCCCCQSCTVRWLCAYMEYITCLWLKLCLPFQ